MPNSSTPESTANNPEDRKNRTYEKPVAWLAGRDLLGGIKGILLYTAYGSKLDPRDWMTGQVFDFKESSAGKEEFWFDFLADAGDGTRAMYAIAYLTMSDLWRGPNESVTFNKADSAEALPRGEFLFVGGDTVYHVADYLTLANRLQRPFTYAFKDLREHGPIAQRPLFGIPGNHDYYDQLDGFRRQFRKPVRPEPPQPPANPGGDHAQLGIAGYKRVQEASYFAIKLPFGWWLWGLDTETGPLDNRQREFFAALGNDDQTGGYAKDAAGKVIPPDKIIIATPSPTTVFGKVADEESDFKATQAIVELLGPRQPFLPTKRPDGTFDFSETGNARLQKGQCRLDIAGDVHHYARYWGPEPNAVKPARERAKNQPRSAKSYASVVSGLGGAFHHPSNTYNDELQEQVLYPDEKASREAVGKEVFNPWSIATGGYVWLFGFIIAFVIYFGASVTQSSRQFLSRIGPLPRVHLNLVQAEAITPTTARPTNTEAPGRPVYFIERPFKEWPKDLWAGQILLGLSLLATMGLFFAKDWLFGPKDNAKKRARARRVTPNPNLKLWLIVPPIAVAVILGMLTIGRYRDHLTPFVSSLMVLYSIIIAVGGIVLTVRYNDYLFQKGHDEYVTKWDRFWPWVLPILSVLVIAAGLWSFGRNNLPAFLVTDIIFTLVVVAVTFAIFYLLPFKASGELLYTSGRFTRFAGKTLIGFWHVVLQLFVPFVLIRKGTYGTWVLAAILVVLPILPAAALFRNNRRSILAIVWVVCGAAMLAVPVFTKLLSGPLGFDPAPLFPSSSWVGAWGLVPSFLAGVAGAVMSCLWFGWYLGVCSAFNGHNNEVGGAARIEKFKQFIRFKVTEDQLTGYVIAVDDVSLIGEQDETGKYYDGRALKPKLIEVFHLEVKK